MLWEILAKVGWLALIMFAAIGLMAVGDIIHGGRH